MLLCVPLLQLLHVFFELGGLYLTELLNFIVLLLFRILVCSLIKKSFFRLNFINDIQIVEDLFV